MPLDLNITPKPEVSFTHPDGITVFAETPDEVEIMVIPRAVGVGRLFLTCVADEVAFREGTEIKSEITLDFHCESFTEQKRLRLPFTLVCSHPSDQDILLRFDTRAINAQQQQSPPILQLPVRLKPGLPLADSDETLPSDHLLSDSATPSPTETDQPHDDDEATRT